MFIRCNQCGTVVSNEVPDGTVIRAWIVCLKCTEKEEKK